MAIQPAGGTGVTCGHCGHASNLGDRFCEQCGNPVAASSTSRDGDIGGLTEATSTFRQGIPLHSIGDHHRRGSDGDATTRYLCAAAHLDPDYANNIIAEYLIEPTRAVPPSPGVDSVAVLREAVAARRRRKIRDGMLLSLVLLVAVASLTLAALWLIAAFLLASADMGKRSRVAIGLVLVVVLGLVVTIFSSVLSVLMQSGFDSIGGSDFAAVSENGLAFVSPGLVAAVVLGLLVVVVLYVDEAVVEELTRRRFRSGSFQADPLHVPSGWESKVRTLGHAQYSQQFERIAYAERSRAEAAGLADVIVHRGWLPFLGAGVPVGDETIALPLEPNGDDDDDQRDPEPFTAEELQAYVAHAVGELRHSIALSPGRRFADLVVRDQVFIPADRLVRDPANPPLRGVLDDLSRPPAMHLPIAAARALVGDPPEAARHYWCFQVQAWDRDLVTSSFFTAGTDQSTLYLEWTHCVLLPVKESYREIDLPASGGPLLRSLRAAVTLPMDAPARLVNLFQRFRKIRQRPGEVVPARYGAGRSLREHAAGTECQSFFQDADALRYLQIIEQTVFRAVSRFLEERRYSVVDVLEVARANIGNRSVTIQGGTFHNSAVGIGRVTQQSGPDQAARPTTSGGRA